MLLDPFTLFSILNKKGSLMKLLTGEISFIKRPVSHQVVATVQLVVKVWICCIILGSHFHNKWSFNTIACFLQYLYMPYIYTLSKLILE